MIFTSSRDAKTYPEFLALVARQGANKKDASEARLANNTPHLLRDMRITRISIAL